MVLLVERLCRSLKLSSKLENHHHQSASLQAFRSHVSNCFTQLSLNSKPKSDFLSLTYIQQCFQLLPMINKAFAKLVMEIDHPMSKWEVVTVEEYLNYSLNLLELLNSISSSLSHLSQARLSLSHALGLVENSPPLAIERLKPIPSKNLSKHIKEGETENEERLSSGKELVIQQALMVMKSIGFWVCGVVLSGLCGDIEPYMEMSKSAGGFVNSSLGSSVCEEIIEKKGVLKDVKEINDAVDCLVAAIATGKSSSNAAKELQRRLEEIEKLLEGVEKDTNHLFSEVLAGRNELLDCLRQQKQ